jgi:hypothetical protein
MPYQLSFISAERRSSAGLVVFWVPGLCFIPGHILTYSEARNKSTSNGRTSDCQKDAAVGRRMLGTQWKSYLNGQWQGDLPGRF